MWKRSSACKADQPMCAEVKRAPGVVAIRNSERPDIAVVLTEDEWDALVQGIAAGEFD